MSPLPQKVDLLKWVDDQQQLDPLSASVLEKLAQFADAEGCAWAKVDTLAMKTRLSIRAVQIRLRKLEAEGLIENTGRSHRLKNSTRSVPIYQLAPDIEGFGVDSSMGAQRAPIDVAWVHEDASMGAPACTRIGLKGDLGESDDSPLRERARERAAFAELEAAYPKAGLKITDREAAWIALCALADDGVEIEQLAACAQAMAVDPTIKRRDYGPPSMQSWMTRGQFRGWWPDDDAEAATAEPPRTACAIPADVVEGLGEGFVAVWAGDAQWRETERTIVTRLGVQAARIRADKRVELSRLGVRVVSQAEAAEPETRQRQPQEA